ncbi:B12-binding domain-containing radical SAM protein [bacterium]|nr:MAG: B12-binding domain-containing radical SAM protein [bacterium]
MKILLLEHPRRICPERCNDIANTPLSSCLLTGYAAGMLESRGHEVVIVEGHMDSLKYGEIARTVEDFRPDMLGVHMVYHWQRDDALYAFLAERKSAGMAPYIAAYGFYPTIAYTDILQDCPAIDAVIVGEHELTFAELAEAVSSTPTGLPGLAERDGSGGISLKRRPLVEDLDGLPFPVRTEAMYRIPEVNLQGSRGCYGRCTFCYINPFYGEKSRWRGRTPENIMAEIDQIMSIRDVHDFYFTDPNFFGPGQFGQERARRIAGMLKQRNIRFGIEGRVNDIHDETIGLLAEAGLRHILIGLESGRDSSLQRMNKMTTVAQNEAAIKTLRKHGIEPNIGFIMFEPDASLDDIRTNFEFLRRNELLNNLAITANVLYHHQIILKGTPAYQHLQQAGRLVQATNYEGITTFANPQVESLANIMRGVTNYLFNRMAGIWGGKAPAPENAREKYAKVNRLLVNTFDDRLKELENGGRFTEDDIAAAISDAEREIGDTLRVSRVS